MLPLAHVRTARAQAAKAGGVNANYYEVEDGTPTGTCAVLVTGVHRSLCTNLGAANK
jgi:adenosine kinase